MPRRGRGRVGGGLPFASLDPRVLQSFNIGNLPFIKTEKLGQGPSPFGLDARDAPRPPPAWSAPGGDRLPRSPPHTAPPSRRGSELALVPTSRTVRRQPPRGAVAALGTAALVAKLGLGLFSFVGRLGVAVAAQTFLAGGWPWLRSACLLALPLPRGLLSPVTLVVGPLASVPRRVRPLAAPALAAAVTLRALAAPVLVVSLIGPLLHWVAPHHARTLRLWRRLLPIYAGYMATKWATSGGRLTPAQAEARWAARHDWGGRKVYAMVLDLSGYFVKSAQILGSKSDFMPQQWTRHLATLFDGMPARPWAEVSWTLRHELPRTPLARTTAAKGRPPPTLGAVFESIDAAALAAASIAQVHTGVLCDDWWPGECRREVVLKVQHKGMEAIMAVDMRNIGDVAHFLRSVLPFDILPIVREIQASIPKEFNFEREARLMAAVRSRLYAAGFAPILRVPLAVPLLCSPRLLIMERMPGTPLTQLLVATAANREERAAASCAVRGLLGAYGHMIFGEGLFHADPHPGNLLLMPDGGLALLDFGQCKALDAATRASLAAVVIALADEDTAAIVAAMAGVGMAFSAAAGGAPAVTEVVKFAYLMFDTRYMVEGTVSPFADNPMLRNTPMAAFNQQLYLVVRAVMLLRGLLFSLGMPDSAVTLWRPYAVAALAEDPDIADARAAVNRCIDDGVESPEQVAAAAALLAAMAPPPLQRVESASFASPLVHSIDDNSPVGDWLAVA